MTLNPNMNMYSKMLYYYLLKPKQMKINAISTMIIIGRKQIFKQTL